MPLNCPFLIALKQINLSKEINFYFVILHGILISTKGCFNMINKVHSFLVKLPVQMMKEGSRFVAFCPALDIATQGKTFEEAQKMFAELVNIFFEELAEKGTTEKVLIQCGWKKLSTQKRWDPPETHLIKEINQEISVPCPV